MVHDLCPLDSLSAKGVLYFTDSKKSVTCGAGSGSSASFSFRLGMVDLKPANNLPAGHSM